MPVSKRKSVVRILNDEILSGSCSTCYNPDASIHTILLPVTGAFIFDDGNRGTGGQGGRGKDSECLGSDGGDDGRGGDGGDGGDGGQGSTLQVKGRLTHAYDLNRILFEAPGGKSGGNGKYGLGGAGGASINCGLYLRGSGDPGSWGQMGNAGKRGIPGALLLDIE